MTIQSTTVSQAHVTVTTSATLLDRNTAGARSLALKNNGSQTVYLGNGSVTTSDGYPLAAGNEMSLDLPALGGGLYGIVAATTCEVDVLQVGRQ